MIPLWVTLSVGAAFFSALMMLLQERFKVEGYALAIWCKITCILVTFPFVLQYGFPDNPKFYIMVFFQGLLFAIADVIMFRAIPIVGAGVFSRLMPVSVILAFLLWFLIDPALLGLYLANPVISGLILLVFAVIVYLASELKKCSVSMDALKRIWFVIFAMTAGTLLSRLIMIETPENSVPFAFTFVEAWVMIVLWLGYMIVARPIPAALLIDRHVIKAGLAVGLAMAAFVVTITAAMKYIDNPGYVSALRFLDVVMIVGIHRATGKNDGSNKLAGLGLVACAVALILLKEQL